MMRSVELSVHLLFSILVWSESCAKGFCGRVCSLSVTSLLTCWAAAAQSCGESG
jgi:hypothetical protein